MSTWIPADTRYSPYSEQGPVPCQQYAPAYPQRGPPACPQYAPAYPQQGPTCAQYVPDPWQGPLFPFPLYLPKYLYHYTNCVGKFGILEDGVIRANSVNVPGYYGPGVFLTSIAPDQGKDKILLNNYGLKVKKDRADHCFEFERRWLRDVRYIKCHQGRDIWVYPRDIHIDILNRDDYYRGIVTLL